MSQFLRLLAKAVTLDTGREIEEKPVPASRWGIPIEEIGDVVETSFGDYSLRVKRLYVDAPDADMASIYGKVKHGPISNYRIVKQFDRILRIDWELRYLPNREVHGINGVRLAHINSSLPNEGAAGHFCWDFGSGQKGHYFHECLPASMTHQVELKFLGIRIRINEREANGDYNSSKLLEPMFPTLRGVADKYLLKVPALNALPRERYVRNHEFTPF